MQASPNRGAWPLLAFRLWFLRPRAVQAGRLGRWCRLRWTVEATHTEEEREEGREEEREVEEEGALVSKGMSDKRI